MSKVENLVSYIETELEISVDLSNYKADLNISNSRYFDKLSQIITAEEVTQEDEIFLDNLSKEINIDSKDLVDEKNYILESIFNNPYYSE